jgi:hypothetical protein
VDWLVEATANQSQRRRLNPKERHQNGSYFNVTQEAGKRYSCMKYVNCYFCRFLDAHLQRTSIVFLALELPDKPSLCFLFRFIQYTGNALYSSFLLYIQQRLMYAAFCRLHECLQVRSFFHLEFCMYPSPVVLLS